MSTKVLPILAARPTDNGICTAAVPQKVRKRKTPPHVSQNACTNCKRARSKCDGDAETTCSRCISREIAGTCRFELSIKASKQELLDRIGELESQLARLQESCHDQQQQQQQQQQLPLPLSPTRSHFTHQRQSSNTTVRRLSAPMMRRDILANAKANGATMCEDDESRRCSAAAAAKRAHGPHTTITMSSMMPASPPPTESRFASRLVEMDEYPAAFAGPRTLPSRPLQRKRTDTDVMRITRILNGGADTER